MDKNKVWNWVLYVSLFLLVLLCLICLALVGEHQQFYKWILTDNQRSEVDSEWKNYRNSMNGIMVLGAFFLLFLPFYVYSAYQTEPKCHYVFLGFYAILFFFGQWIALLVFLTGYSDYRKSTKAEWVDGWNKDESTCNNSSANLIRCAYTWSFADAQRAATAYIVFLSIFGLLIIYPLLKINRERTESNVPGQHNNDAYADKNQAPAAGEGIN